MVVAQEFGLTSIPSRKLSLLVGILVEFCEFHVQLLLRSADCRDNFKSQKVCEVHVCDLKLGYFMSRYKTINIAADEALAVVMNIVLFSALNTEHPDRHCI